MMRYEFNMYRIFDKFLDIEFLFVEVAPSNWRAYILTYLNYQRISQECSDSITVIHRLTEHDESIFTADVYDEIKRKVKLVAIRKFKRKVIDRMNAIIKFNAITGDAVKDIAAKCISNLAEKDHYLYVTKIETGVLQEFLNVTAGEVENFGVCALRDEAQYYFSDALRVYSHAHEDYAHIRVSGTLDKVVIEESA